ncbi:hypothetical protein E5F05_02095 (plasmid) [Deinococcus metallilatus]|uniref:Secreted protein n=1 Tax=Deinococcus metallilatus TaxID=1211322 RepID=A0ABR6MX42_9DEIO|nr:hypothetical protein [Deinococcus metallilatus]MBB5295811.1 hypothetical protein [Deinococcus metallilatus]QBY06759.1 hypothetical protein E5F05_02095 [Deinococcus metallilatus]GMA14339.1 hypothetical protein GCM10025871_06700 [Deinococcus metallilatus]
MKPILRRLFTWSTSALIFIGTSLALGYNTANAATWIPRTGYAKYVGSDGNFRAVISQQWSSADLEVLKNSGSRFYEADFSMPNGQSESPFYVDTWDGRMPCTSTTTFNVAYDDCPTAGTLEENNSINYGYGNQVSSIYANTEYIGWLYLNRDGARQGGYFSANVSVQRASYKFSTCGTPNTIDIWCIYSNASTNVLIGWRVYFKSDKFESWTGYYGL